MSLEPDLVDQDLLADSFRRSAAAPTRREHWVGAILACGFFAACGGLWALRPPGHFNVVAAGLCLLVLAAATRVHFDTPLGFTVPTQLAFVPLLFAAPPALVPLACVCALALARLPDLLRREVPASRLLQIPGNAWFAIGPPAVFVAAGTDPWHAGPILLLTALAAQFAVDFGVSSVRYSIALDAPLSSQLGETWVYGVDAALSAVALVIAHATRQTPAAVLTLLPLLALLGLFARERHHRLESLIELNNAYRGTALVLGDVVEADDGYTGQHCKSVVALAREVGAQLKLGAAQARNLEFAALLHDVGKVAIPKEIINNPGKLDEHEWALMKTHPLEGQNMLSRVGGFMCDVGLVVRSHHERWDGGGYPDGLVGEAIPLESRIITCCDSWNAMRTDRSYRMALTYEQALAEMKAHTGSQFDPRIVDALLPIVAAEEQPAHSEPPHPAPLTLVHAGSPEPA
jgi:HD-GYP domain-containing protein (c-di-GMP phosphodiesterase class II)